jgi:DNA-binding response OmpR family regulator
MSDDDLVKRLWESDEASALTNQAARRIEELGAKLKAVTTLRELMSHMWGEAEDKLSKAVEALIRIEDLNKRGVGCGSIARTTLAELKWEDRG